MRKIRCEKEMERGVYTGAAAIGHPSLCRFGACAADSMLSSSQLPQN